MKNAAILELTGLIKKNISILEDLYAYSRELKEKEIPENGETRTIALAVAGVIENYYTCSETIFLRLAQYFENNLSPHKWHKELLEKMAMEIPEIRPVVIQEETRRQFDELLRFRHFKRYYFEIDFDWDRLNFLLKKLKELHPCFMQELKAYIDFLMSIKD